MIQDGEGGLATSIDLVQWSFVGEFSNWDAAARAAHQHKIQNSDQNELRIQQNSDEKWSVWARKDLK